MTPSFGDSVHRSRFVVGRFYELASETMLGRFGQELCVAKHGPPALAVDAGRHDPSEREQAAIHREIGRGGLPVQTLHAYVAEGLHQARDELVEEPAIPV